MIYALLIYHEKYPEELANILTQHSILTNIYKQQDIIDNFENIVALHDIIIFYNTNSDELEKIIQDVRPYIVVNNDKIRFAKTNEYLVLSYKHNINQVILTIVHSLARLDFNDDIVYLLNSLLNYLDQPTLLLKENKIIHANKHFLTVNGKNYEEIIHTTIDSYFTNYQIQEFRNFLTSNQDKKIFNFKFMNNAEDEYLVTKINFTLNNQIYYLLILDPNNYITNKDFWYNLFDTFSEPLRIMDMDGNTIYVNKEYAKLFEMPISEIIGKHFTVVYSQDYRNKIYSTFKDKFNNKNLRDDDKSTVFLHNGKKKYLYRRNKEIFLKDKKCILTILKDLTHEKEVQEENKKKSELLTLILTLSSSIIFTSKEKFSHILQSSLNLISNLFDVDLAYLSIQTEFIKVKQYYYGENYHYFRDKINNNDFIKYFPFKNEIINLPYNKDVNVNISALLNEKGVNSVLSIPIIYKDTVLGNLNFISFSNKIIWNNEDVNILLIFADLLAGNLEKIKTEYLLEMERAKLYDIFQNMNDGIIVCDDNLDILFFNNKANELLNLNKNKNILELAKDVLAKKGKDNYYDKDVPSILNFLHQNLNKTVDNIEIVVNNEKKYLNVYISTFNKATNLFLITITDVTDKVKLQTELALSQKLEAVGRLAAGIAHEINTPMQFINDNLVFINDALVSFNNFLNEIKTNNITNIDELIEKYDIKYLTSESITALKESFEGVDRIVKIVAAMKDFAHTSQTREKTLSDINKILETTITISRNVWKYHSDIIINLDKSLPLIECYSDELGQVFLNMIVNSAHAIEEKFTNEGKKGIIEIISIQENDNVVVIIKDNGIGIKEEYLSRIYDPFFTTKEVGKGTGQGLAIAHDIIVNKHQGEIKCNSVYGEGTEFKIYLPLKV